MKILMISGELTLRMKRNRRITLTDDDFRLVVDKLRKSKRAWIDLADEYLLSGNFESGEWGGICIQVMKDGQLHDVAFDDTDDPSLGTGHVEAK